MYGWVVVSRKGIVKLLDDVIVTLSKSMSSSQSKPQNNSDLFFSWLCFSWSDNQWHLEIFKNIACSVFKEIFYLWPTRDWFLHHNTSVISVAQVLAQNSTVPLFHAPCSPDLPYLDFSHFSRDNDLKILKSWKIKIETRCQSFRNEYKNVSNKQWKPLWENAIVLMRIILEGIRLFNKHS